MENSVRTARMYGEEFHTRASNFAYSHDMIRHLSFLNFFPLAIPGPKDRYSWIVTRMAYLPSKIMRIHWHVPRMLARRWF